ncbi:hypothetical protein ACP70R_035439 [Stipagrostis hirtigluma subsp. patula]
MDGNTCASLEELEEYNSVISQTFRSEQEFYKFYNSYAEDKGFSVRKEKVRREPSSGEVTWRRFCCSCEGYRSVECFERTDKKSGLWFVKDFVDVHNHPLAKPQHVFVLRSHRRISEPQQAEAIELGLGGLRTCQIMDVMDKNYGGPRETGFLLRDLYNFFARMKKERVEGSDAEYVLNFMREKQDHDLEFFFKYSVDDEGRLKNIFWSDAQSQLDYGAFGDVVVFDSTYRVNRYNLPFVPFVGVDHHRSTVVFGCDQIGEKGNKEGPATTSAEDLDDIRHTGNRILLCRLRERCGLLHHETQEKSYNGQTNFRAATEKKSTIDPAKKQKGTLQLSQNKLVGLLKSFSQEQKDAIEKAGFGSLLKLQKMGIARKLCKEIANTFDIKTEEFVIGERRIKMTVKDVDHILGLPSEGDEIQESQKKDVPHLFERYKGKGNSIQLTVLKQYFSTNKEDHGEDFVRRAILYIIGVYLCPTTQPNVTPDYLGLLENFEAIEKLNWSSLVLNNLISSIKKFREGGANIEGNLCLLQVWFWEKLSIYHLNGTITRTGRERPIMQFWTQTRAIERKQSDRLCDFGVGQIVDDITQTAPVNQPSTSHGADFSTETRQHQQANMTNEEALQKLFSLVEAQQLRIQQINDRTIETQEMCQSTNQCLRSFINNLQGGRPHKTYKSKKKGKIGAHDKEQPSNVKEDEKAKSGDKGENNDKDKPAQKDNRKRKNQGDTTDAQARTRPPSGRAHKPINNKDFVRCTGDDNPTIQYIDASRPKKTLVHIHDVTLTKERLQRIRRIDEWLNDQEIIAYAYCLQEDKNLTTRDGGRVCVTIPRFQRWFATNGHHLKVTGQADYVPWVLDHVADFTDYDMVLMPMYTQLLRLESYLQEAANQIGSKWKNLRVASWPFEQVQCPQQTDTWSCGLFMLMFMRYWTGTRLSTEFTQEDIYNFRSKLPVLLVDSKLNKINGGPKSSQPDGKGCDSDNAIDVE